MNEKIIEYLKQRYKPSSIIVYGSFADNSNNQDSDFDALVLTNEKHEYHNGETVNGIELDVFIYDLSLLESVIEYENFISIYDGIVVYDIDDVGKKLIENVRSYIQQLPRKSPEEKIHSVEWCKKMVLRTKRCDAEGFFRWHWLLTESLEIYFSLNDKYYFGPKKSLKELKKSNFEAYKMYYNALIQLDFEALEKWINYIREYGF